MLKHHKVNLYKRKEKPEDTSLSFDFFFEGCGGWGCIGSIGHFDIFPNGMITRYKTIEFYEQDVRDAVEQWKKDELARITKEVIEEVTGRKYNE